MRRLFTLIAIAVLAVASFGTVAASHDDGVSDADVQRCEAIAARLAFYPSGSSQHDWFSAMYERHHCDEVLG